MGDGEVINWPASPFFISRCNIILAIRYIREAKMSILMAILIAGLAWYRLPLFHALVYLPRLYTTHAAVITIFRRGKPLLATDDGRHALRANFTETPFKFNYWRFKNAHHASFATFISAIISREYYWYYIGITPRLPPHARSRRALPGNEYIATAAHKPRNASKYYIFTLSSSFPLDNTPAMLNASQSASVDCRRAYSLPLYRWLLPPFI